MVYPMPDKEKHTEYLRTRKGKVKFYSLRRWGESSGIDISRLPYSIRVLAESLLRQMDGKLITAEDLEKVASWSPQGNGEADIPFIPARVVLQDFTGVPAVVDLASMRSAVATMGADPSRINPIIPVDLVIDHSIQLDHAGSPDSILLNEALEMERNRERYALLKWARGAFQNFRAVPPGNGIIHQVNLEFLSPLVHLKEVDGQTVAYPDSCFGTDSHTTQINGLGVLGWGVGGIEAEAVMLGQPYYMPLPDVVGFKLTGKLPPGSTATDLVLTVVEMLRRKGVVGKFVEYYGPGYRELALADRATLANMGPEYGATMGYCPVDEKTIEYLRITGRDEDRVSLAEDYCREQGLWYEEDPEYSDVLELDLSQVVPCLAGHRRPQDRIPLPEMKSRFHKLLQESGLEPSSGEGLGHGSVVIASITSCTNTANPSVMVGAGLLARNAVRRGLRPRPWVKTSLSPGSKVVTAYLEKSGLMTDLETLGFHNTGYGCMTCIGNSGPLSDEVEKKIAQGNLLSAAVVSANRNFDGRVSPHVKANYLASPALVIAYSLCGRVDIDLENEPLGTDTDGQPVFLKDIWPQESELQSLISSLLRPELFQEKYADVFQGSELWDAIEVPEGDLFQWDDASTYVRNPPFFDELRADTPSLKDLNGARALAYLGDSITTDHISPAGSIDENSDAGIYLLAKGVQKEDFNSYGSRRGNHEVMMRGTFANIRLRNRLADGREGGWSKKLPEGEVSTMFQTSQAYLSEGTPLIILAGKEYGTGSSRDWAAKGPFLLGVKAVIAQSFERIHRSNLIGMGVVPLQFRKGEDATSLGLDGTEVFNLRLSELRPRQEIDVRAVKRDGSVVEFCVLSRVDTDLEQDFVRNGGILQTVMQSMVG